MLVKAASKGKIKIAIRCAAFLLAFCSLFVFVSYLFRPSQNAQEREGFYEFYAEPRNSLDLVYIGGSICIVCWAPYVAWNEAGIRSYSFGVSQLLPTAYIPMIREVYKRQSPELLVLDLRPFQYGGDYCYTDVEVRKTSDWMPYSWNRLRFVADTLSHFPEGTLSDAPSYYADLIKYHGEWQHITQDSFRYDGYGKSICPTKGFAIVERCSPQTLWNFSSVTEAEPVTDLAETALRELLAFLRRNRQQAIFVVTAYAEEESHRWQYNYLQDIIEEEGFAYWNANDCRDEIGVDGNTDYYDPNHMNLFGAEKYTAYLARYVSDRYPLPDRRNEPASAGWWDGYSQWCEISDSIKEDIRASVTSAG